MTITEKIRQSVEGATGWRLHYDAEGNINRLLDSVELPCAFLYLLRNGVVDAEDGQQRERLRIGIFFVNKTEFDFDTAENEEIIAECKRIGNVWVNSLRKDPFLRMVGSQVQTERVYDKMDVIVTGIGFTLEVEELYGYNPCTDSEHELLDVLYVEQNGVYDVRGYLNVQVNVSGAGGIDIYEQGGNFCVDGLQMEENNAIIEHRE